MERTLEKMVGGSRAAVLRALESGPRSVGDIVIETRLSQPNVSNHLARLRELGLVVAQREGRRVFYRIVSPDLVRALLLSPANTHLTEAERKAIIEELQPTFESQLLEGEHQGVRSLIDRALGEGLPWQDLYTQVFSAALNKISAMRSAGKISVAQERTVRCFIERLMSHVGSLRVPPRKAGKCDVVVTCAPGEYNDIDAQMAADFLAVEGFNVAFLGADVPAREITDCARQLESGVIVAYAAGGDGAAVAKAVSALGSGAPKLLITGDAQPGADKAAADLYELCAQVSEILK